jgi:NtrC-family two-component system response regulator AlgB
MDKIWSALILDDDPGVRQSIRLCLEADHGRVLGVGTSAGALEALERNPFDVVFLDLWLNAESGLNVLPEILRRQPGVPVVVITAFATFETAVEAMKRGAVDYLPKPFTPEQVRGAARRAVAERILQRQVSELRERLDDSERELLYETNSPVYRAFLQTAERVAAVDSVVLLRGESGTGKTVFARWLRARSRRAEGPFVTVHCPLLSAELMSSVLFGHCKGAFTGAVGDTVGKVEEAQGGTLFLDEVGDLTSDAQVRLLRFLHDRTYERLGEAKERRADVRLITATNRDLEAEVRAGRFREDLWFRLNVITLTLPPLRERPEDIPTLAQHYLQAFAAHVDRRSLAFSPRCSAVLAAYPWPGNLRELRNAVERATILAPGTLIEPQDLGLPTLAMGLSATDFGGGTAPAARPSGLQLGGDFSLEDVEREHIARVLARAPSLDAAARLLGIDPTTLQRKRKRYGLA